MVINRSVGVGGKENTLQQMTYQDTKNSMRNQPIEILG